ncbi:MAG: ZIP family metal transporter [Legionellales bacterium]|nr:ZIP family metal transporter [Legionellales bacterium]
MDFNWVAFWSTIIAGISTGVGAIPIYFKQIFEKKHIDLGLGFSAGIMLVASFTALILPSIDFAKTTYNTNIAIFPVLFALLLGYIFIVGIHRKIPHQHLFKNTGKTDQKQLTRTGLIILAICLHNIPEGLSVGVGFGTGDNTSGVLLAAAISLQNMPEGLVVALSLISIGENKHRAFLIALLTGLIEPIFALFGFISATITAYSLPVALAFAGGAMLFVVCQELFPELFKASHEKNAMLGVLVGILTMFLLNYWLA